MTAIRAVIVDDEPLARERIRTLLAESTDVEVVAECADGVEAVGVIESQRPDLLFLDVQMPEVDGFEVLEAVGPECVPVTVFVTAYDAYALRAFEVHALDYLLKPFDRPRFAKALDRARTHLEGSRRGDLRARLGELLAGPRRPPGADRLVVRGRGRVQFVTVGEVDWVESAGNYVRLHSGTDVHLLRQTMARVERRLAPAGFARTHRSVIVNLERVREIQPVFNGDAAVVLQNGEVLPLSRTYRAGLMQRFKPDD